MLTDEERRRLWGLAWSVREFGEAGLEPGVVSELAAGVLALVEEQVAQGDSPDRADLSALEKAGPAAPGEHDQSTEEAVLRAFKDPTLQNQNDAELAVSLLQRRYDHVLHRLDGAAGAPPYPVHRHDASEHPVDCLRAVLHELAGAALADRAATLADGLHAARALQHQVREARGWARGFEHSYFTDVDTDAPPEWLTAPLSIEGTERGPRRD